PLQERIDLGGGDIRVDAVRQRAEALPRLREGQCWATLEALVAREQRRRDEARHVLQLAHIDADVEGLVAKLRHEVEWWCRSRSRRMSLWHSPPPSEGKRDGGERGGGGGSEAGAAR